MRRLWKTVLSLTMTALLIAVTLISSFAISAKPYKGIRYDYYTYLGDSIPFGYGLVPEEVRHDPFSVGLRVENSYTDLVADVLETNNPKMKVRPGTSSGSRLCDYRILLERGMKVKDPYDVQDDWYGSRHPERTVKLRTMGPQVVSWLQKSDLVTMQVGINDLTGLLVNSAYATGLVDLNKLESLDGIEDVVSYLDFVIGNLGKDADVVGNFLRTFQKELNGILVNADVVLKDVQLLAPKDADILVVGYHMAVKDFRVIPGTPRSVVFDLIDSVLATLNAYFASLTAKYDNVYYVSAPDADVFFPKDTTLLDMLKDTDRILWGVHPNAKGHRYIAKQVLNKLKEINS